MKQQIPGWVVAVIVVVIVLIIGLVYFKADMGGGAKAEKIEGLIRATASGSGAVKGSPAPKMPTPAPKAP